MLTTTMINERQHPQPHKRQQQGQPEQQSTSTSINKGNYNGSSNININNDHNNIKNNGNQRTLIATKEHQEHHEPTTTSTLRAITTPTAETCHGGPCAPRNGERAPDLTQIGSRHFEVAEQLIAVSSRWVDVITMLSGTSIIQFAHNIDNEPV